MLCAHSRHRPYSSVVAHRADRARTVQMLAAVAHAREQTAFDLTRPKPVVILVCPSMPENIGSAARAMKNFGLEELRLVSPKDGWTAGAPNALADATAAHAVPVVRAARLFSSAAEAVADLHLVYAATARERSMNKQVVLSRDLYSDVQAWRAQQLDAMGEADGAEVPELRLGLMFGRESSGLTNEEVGLAHKVLTIDAHPGYPVLNLAQAVVLSAYELYQGHERAALLLATAGASQASNPHSHLPPCAPPKPSINSSSSSDGNQGCTSSQGAPLAAAQPQSSAGQAALTGLTPQPHPSCSPSSNPPLPRPASEPRGNDGLAPPAPLHSPADTAHLQTPPPSLSSSPSPPPLPSPPSPSSPLSARANSHSPMRGTAAAGLYTKQPASQRDVDGFLKMLYVALTEAGFDEGDESKVASVQLSIRNLLARVTLLSMQDLGLLHGMLSKLTGAGHERRAALAAQRAAKAAAAAERAARNGARPPTASSAEELPRRC